MGLKGASLRDLVIHKRGWCKVSHFDCTKDINPDWVLTKKLEMLPRSGGGLVMLIDKLFK